MHVETGFCGYEVDETAWGTYIWPETKGGNSAILTCQLDDTVEVTRHCRNGGGWDTADYEDCILRQLEVNWSSFIITHVCVCTRPQFNVYGHRILPERISVKLVKQWQQQYKKQNKQKVIL